MTPDNNAHSAPSEFVDAWISELAVHPERSPGVRAPAPQRALDVAMGRGRHSLLLARRGFQTFGVDVNCDAVHDAMAAAAREGLRIRGWCADLTVSPLPSAAFDLVVVARYLQRHLFGAIKASLKPRGCVIYETFTTAQLALGVGPTSPDHLLRPGELRSLFADWDVLCYEEVDAPDAVARMVARSRSV